MSTGRDFRAVITFVAFLLILVIVGGQAGADKKIICDYCKEQIKGQYIEANGKFFHPIHFRCENCGFPIGHVPYYLKNGKYYCEKCYNELFAPRCSYCGKIIEGESIIYRGKSYHDSCYTNHAALRCSICGRVIKGEYIVDFWGNTYHKEHQNEYSECDYCGRFICDRLTNGGRQYSDGRHICRLCLESAVTSMTGARLLFDRVKSHLANTGIIIEDKEIKLHLVDLKQMMDLTRINSADHKGYTKYEKIIKLSGDTVFNIDVYILDDMPEIGFLATAAHELMHVWQYLNAPLDNDPLYCEGSCCYASYLVLLKYPGRKAEYLIRNMDRNEDEIYGKGYRRVKKLVADRGVTHWLQHLKNNKYLPGGY